MNSLLDMLVQDASYQMKNPGLRSTTADGKLHGIFFEEFIKVKALSEGHKLCVRNRKNTTFLSKQVGEYFYELLRSFQKT